MINRRDFIKHSGKVAGTALLIPSLLKSCPSGTGKYPPPGLQLYTVREAMEKDPGEALAKVAEIGYKEMESATYTGTQKFYGMDGAAFSEVLKKNGLEIPSGHYLVGSPELKGTIVNGWDKAVEDGDRIGMKYMVCAYLMEDQRKTLDDYKKRAEEFNKAGETCKSAGIQFCYHNHAFEFEKIDGQVPYDILLNQTDPGLVKMEMDIYWVTKAGLDPVAMFQNHPGRFELWHVKDMDDTPKQYFTEIGNGVIDWETIFSHADESGMKYYFVEQDHCPGSPFVSIEKSITYLQNNII